MQPRVVPPVLKREEGELQNVEHVCVLEANMLDISGHFVGQRNRRVVPVGDLLNLTKGSAVMGGFFK